MYIEMNEEDSHCGIVEFYGIVAGRRHYKLTENTRFACTKIDVAENIANNIMRYMEDVQGYESASVGMIWCCYGPKATKALKDNFINIEEGFIYEQDGE